MKIYVLKIKIKNSGCANLREIERYLKTEFKSYDYMLGFLDGNLFDNYFLEPLDVFEKRLNNTGLQEEYFIKFLTVLDLVDDDDN